MSSKLDNRAKMRVKYAAQLFSKSVEAVLKLIDEEKRQAGLQPAGHLVTAQFVGFMDKLFDSVNGYTMFPSNGKPLFSVLRENSGHLEFWEEAKAKINSWRLFTKTIDKKTGLLVLRATGRATVQDGWIHTLNSLRCLWEDLHANYDFTSLSLRRLNQDALENFFAQIRLAGQWSQNPTVTQFISAVKTALVDCLTNSKVRGSNCELDDLTFLASLNALLGGKRGTTNDNEEGFVDNFDYSPLSEEADPSSGAVEAIPTLGERLSKHSLVYVSGFIAKGLLRKSDCSSCRRCIRTDTIDESHLFIRLKEYDPSSPRLVLPSKELTYSVSHAKNLYETFIRPTIHVSNIRKRFFGFLCREVDFSWLCQEHHLENLKLFCKLFCKVVFHSECKRLNKGGMWKHLSASNARMMSRFLQRKRLGGGKRRNQMSQQQRKTQQFKRPHHSVGNQR